MSRTSYYFSDRSFQVAALVEKERKQKKITAKDRDQRTQTHYKDRLHNFKAV